MAPTQTVNLYLLRDLIGVGFLEINRTTSPTKGAGGGGDTVVLSGHEQCGVLHEWGH